MAMLTSPQFEGLQDAYVAVAGQIADHYEYTNAPRGHASHECLHMGFTLANPVSRVLFPAARKINIVFHFAEALWYLWGKLVTSWTIMQGIFFLIATSSCPICASRC